MARKSEWLAAAAEETRTSRLLPEEVCGALARAFEHASTLARHDEYLADRASTETLQSCPPVYDVLVDALADVAEKMAPRIQEPPF